jgi:hypothetical protein
VVQITVSFSGMEPDAVAVAVDTMRAVPDVEDIHIGERRNDLDSGAHKGIVTDLIVKLSDKAFDRLGAALMALFGLPGAPLGTITIGTAKGTASFNFDPRRHSLEEVVTQMKRLVEETERNG